MAARLTPAAQPLVYPGLAPVHTAVSADGDVLDVGRTFLSVLNGGSGAITVTVQTPETVDGDLAIAERVVTVPVGTAPKLIPLNSPHYRQTTASAVLPADVGKAYVDYSATASVTRAVVMFA
ncbi:hypothetical protein [Amycolatopsis sp. H20-H5]|uniref:hypothetical protein n=1 Tax=Amycolatopsis sp. H20-H5 TaxID=3046309 RepID=UPI002DB7A168|nr:hypothetical protein [Amycolatopsis sp. H20-H5]MEC3975088.1 hypothetical protein [Amycolatopsis sp. H20-H5]